MNRPASVFGDASWSVLIGRLLMLGVAATFAIMGLRVALGVDQHAERAEQYVCPMHPEVTSNKPSQCPICKMELELVGAESHAHGTYSCAMHPDVTSDNPGACPICKMELTIAAQKPQLHAMQKAKTRPRKGAAFSCPMHPEETSNEPGRCSICKMDLVQQEKPPGAYACPMHPDETSDKPGSCSICKMDLKATASAVEPPIATEIHHDAYACPMHSDETSGEPGSCSICKMALVPQKSERVFACPMHTKETSDTSDQCPTCGMAMEPIAEMRARGAVPTTVPGFESAPWNWETFPTRSVPITDGKPRLAKPTKRSYVESVRAGAWCDDWDRVFAVIYEDEVAGLNPGDQGVFYRFKSPKTPIPVTLSNLEPRSWDHVTFSLVFLVDQPSRSDPMRPEPSEELLVGDTGWVEMPNRLRRLLSIPEDALLMSGRERYVLLAEAEGGFVRRRVHVGTFVNGYATLLEGLTSRDQVVVGNAFFPDVERGSEFPTIGVDNEAENAFFTGDRRSSVIGDH